MAGDVIQEAPPSDGPVRPTRRGRIRGFIRRHPKASVLALVVGIVFVVFVLAWFQPQKLFYDKTVNEGLPGVIQSAAPPTATPSPAASIPTAAPSSVAPKPPALQVLASGDFRSLEHGTTGMALVLRRADGSLILRLENLDTSNGPDLRVYLSQVPASDDWHAYSHDFIDLGTLRGNKGSQNYAIRKGTDLGKFKSAVIWCRRFKVGFGVAGLPQLSSL
jgi:hypothetical protein